MKISPQTRFCLIEFRPRGWGRSPLPPARASILITYTEAEGLHVFANPDLHNRVDGEDFDFLQALVTNWPAYARLDIAEFFRQIHTLGIGPLMLAEEGSNLLDYPSLVEFYSRFIPFE